MQCLAAVKPGRVSGGRDGIQSVIAAVACNGDPATYAAISHAKSAIRRPSRPEFASSNSPRLDRVASGGEDKTRNERLWAAIRGSQLKDICNMNRSYRAEYRRRKFAMMGRLVTGVALSTIGIRGGYVVVGLGGFFIAIHAIFLCLDPEELMSITEDFFRRVRRKIPESRFDRQ